MSVPITYLGESQRDRASERKRVCARESLHRFDFGAVILLTFTEL